MSNFKMMKVFDAKVLSKKSYEGFYEAFSGVSNYTGTNGCSGYFGFDVDISPHADYKAGEPTEVYDLLSLGAEMGESVLIFFGEGS